MPLDLRVWVTLPFLVSTINALRILVLFPVYMKSHSILGQGVVTHLLKAGHEELQKLMDESKHGVIYFSMGSNLKSAEMSKEMKKSLLDAFSKLKETIIWKFEEDMEKPSNVHFVKWAPQQSILAHPNCNLFITHGGQLSTIEAIHYGIPVIGVPVLGDQHINMMSVVEKGFGIKLDLAEDLADTLKVALHEMVHNLSYKNKAKEISQIFHDRTMAPGDELVFWIEHVIKTQGALHLRSPALHVP